MTGEQSDVDVALDGLHADKKKVLTAQLRSIEEEIVERRLIASDTTLQVNDEMGNLTNEILNLTPSHQAAPDVERKDRMLLERARSDLTHELRGEQRDAWKDVQQLKREERDVEKELLAAEQRHKRTKDLL